MKRCQACGGEYRKGARVFLIGQGMCNVCPKCAGGGVTVVAMAVVPPAKPSREPARENMGAYKTILAQLRLLSRAALSVANDNGKSGDVRAWSRGRSEGFDGAIETIKRAIGCDP